MSMSFTAIDFETANPKRGSVCAVGMAKFRDGQLIDQFYQLVDPPSAMRDFSHWNVRVHGISAQQVAGMPTWDRVHPLVEEFVGDDLIVAHNAPFDASVLIGACTEYQIAPRPSPYLCTLELARAKLTLTDFKLPTVAGALGIELASHHHALDDATTAGWIAAHFLAGITRHDIDQTASVHSVPVDFLGQARKRRIGSGGSGRFSSFRPTAYVPNMEADPSHLFFGRKFVFTGDLETLSRGDAAELVAARGGRITGSVSKMTAVLVVGAWDPSSLGDGRKLSGKALKAIELLEAGHEIQIWTEQDLIANL